MTSDETETPFVSATNLVNIISKPTHAEPRGTLLLSSSSQECPEISENCLLQEVTLTENSNSSVQQRKSQTAVVEAAAAIDSTAAAVQDVAAALARSTASLFSLPSLASTVEALSSVSAALGNVSAALSDILVVPLLEDFISSSAAKTLVVSSVVAEDKALSLVHATSDFTNAVENLLRRNNGSDLSICSPLASNPNLGKVLSMGDVLVQKIVRCDLENIALATTPAPIEKRHASKHGILLNLGYTLGEVLGRGSISVTQTALSKFHGCKVAIKIISKSKVRQVYGEKYMERQLGAVQMLDHPNVIAFLQIIESNCCIYIIMEYADRGNLCDIIKTESCIEEERAKRWFRQLVSAVKHCHEKGIVHRDITCENVLVDAEDNIKLSGFYFVDIIAAPGGGDSQLSETFCGTLAYASPEVLHRIPYDPKLSDVWSMGTVLYAIVCGCLPFRRQDYNPIEKSSNYELVFPKHPKISPASKSLLQKMMSPEYCRIKVSDIFLDPWLQSSRSPSNIVLAKDDQETGRHHTDDSKVKKSLANRIKTAMKHFKIKKKVNKKAAEREMSE